MATWHKTGCALCARSCGLEVLVEGDTIVRARGVNVNHLTAAAHRDLIAATPLHRYVPCRVEVI